MKIQAILNNGQPIKAGQGKKGPWEMFEVELDSGDTASLFGPIKIGMEVETYDHEKYGLQYRVKRVTFEQIHEELQALTKLIMSIVDQLAKRPTGYEQAQKTAERIQRPRHSGGTGSEPTRTTYTADEYDPNALNEIFPED